MPRVGWAAMTKRVSGSLSSRATTTFCLLPPDSDLAGVRIPGVLTSKQWRAVRVQ